jgi:PAS domain S-box-containing protein/putative nucleotidyltransferase with HDIG domain
MPKTILIVEDENITIHLVKKYIREIGYDSISAATGEEAIQMVAASNPALVLMDIILSGSIDGIEAARQINEIHKIPVVYITSSSDNETLKRALTTNPSGYIVKPFDKKELKSVIDMALLRHDMEEKIKENELRFFTILNSIDDAVIVFDDSDLISYVNPMAEKIFESNIDQIVGKSLRDIINLNYCESQTDLDDVLNGISYYYFISKSGKKTPINFAISPIKDISGSKVASVVIMRNDSIRVNFELKLNDSYLQIKKAINGIVQAMAQTLEMRDPYTAGHQRQVADIAKSIAREMGLSENQVEGIFMAGIIHDLGKISIPSEILIKPSEPTPIEWNIIKTHPQTGYDILKSIEFPWPLAEMVYQHHERQDGSGYPRGLAGNDILLEARILCVADVIDAMASDRPYRPAKGMDTALEEITANKGKLYDKDVAEICEKIFRERIFQLK